MEIEKQLQKLQGIYASESLKNRLEGMVSDLPAKHRGFYLPLVAFQGVVVTAVLLLLVAVGSGVVTAAGGKHVASTFHAVQQIIQKVPAVFEKPKSTPTPTVVPSRIPSPTAILTPVEKNHGSQKSTNDNSKKDGNNMQKNVQGASDEAYRGNNKNNSFHKGNSQGENIFNRFFQKGKSKFSLPFHLGN